MSQQIINIGSAPGDATGDAARISFDKCNDNFSELYDGAGTGSEGIWNFNQTSTDTTTAPVSGRFRTNSGNYRDATQLAIHVTTIRGIDRTNTLRRLVPGDVIECHDSADVNAWCRYIVQAAPVDYGTWFQINVGLSNVGTASSGDNQEIDFIFTANTNPGSGGTAEYRFSTATTPPPGAGYIRCNNASLGATTILYINNSTNNGADIKRTLLNLSVGQELVIQDQGNSANYGDYNVASAVIDQTSYVEIPVTSTASGGSINNNDVILFTILGGGGGAAGGNVSNVGTPLNGQLAQWTDATHIQGIDVASFGYAPLASPVFTGDPQAPTPATADNDTSIATTAFVKAQGYLIANQTVTLSGDVTGSGATAITATIANNAVTNAKLADMATARIRGRITAATGDPEDLTGTQATTLLDLFTSSLKGLVPSSGGGTTNFLRADATWAAPATGGTVVPAMGGRLTAQSLTAVPSATITSSGVMYYTRYLHDRVAIYDGTTWTVAALPTGELFQNLNDTTKSPAAAVANSNYDYFVWSDAGTLRCTRGPVWASSVSRGTGAGTTELVRVNGVWMNAQNITNGPAAQRGTYVGSIRTDANATVTWQYGAAAVGGTPGLFSVWNMYNRVNVSSITEDTFGSASVTATNQLLNLSATNRCSFIVGLQEDMFSAEVFGLGIPGSGGNISMGVGFDGAATAGLSVVNINNVTAALSGSYSSTASPGWHFFQAIQNAVAANGTIYGSQGATLQHTGLKFDGRM